MDRGVGGRDDFGNRNQHYFGNHHPLETTGSEGGLSDRYRDESAFHAADGGSDESGRLWNDGSSCNYSGRFTLHIRGGFSCGLALQLLAVEETRQELPLSIMGGNSRSISKLALLRNS